METHLRVVYFLIGVAWHGIVLYCFVRVPTTMKCSSNTRGEEEEEEEERERKTKKVARLVMTSVLIFDCCCLARSGD